MGNFKLDPATVPAAANWLRSSDLHTDLHRYSSPDDYDDVLANYLADCLTDCLVNYLASFLTSCGNQRGLLFHFEQEIVELITSRKMKISSNIKGMTILMTMLS